MIKQNKTKLQFIFGGILVLTFAFASCNGSGDTQVTVKDSVVTESKTVITAPPVKDSTDTMEVIKGEKAPGSDVKPQ